MAITDSEFANLTGEIRIRQGAAFQQIPNLVEAGEDLLDGMFVEMTSDGTFHKCNGATTAPTHLVLKSAEPRLTAVEVAELTGTIQDGEPTLSITGGPGTVDIPFASNVTQGDELTTNLSGFAVRRTGASFCIGVANADVSLNGEDTAIGEAFITLPATWRAS